jgi:hypothetical protein
MKPLERKVQHMRHTLQISVSKETPGGGIISCRHVTVREKLLRFLLGKRQRLTVIVPGDSVESVSINEVGGKGGKEHE